MRSIIPDDSIGSLAKLLGDIVPLIDNELLIEHLEHFAALEVRHGLVDEGGRSAAALRRGAGLSEGCSAKDCL